MRKEIESEPAGAWVVRDVPRELMHRTKVAAAIERKSVKQFLMDVVEAHLEELDRKGKLPKGR